MAPTDLSGDRLAQRLEELMELERFDPPEGFAADALIKDESLYERADADPVAFWLEQAKALHWA